MSLSISNPALANRVPLTVGEFLQRAKDQIHQGLGDKPLIFRDEENRLIHLGSIFEKAVKGMALPSEIENAERRYGKRLKDLRSDSRIYPLDILKFATAFCDKTVNTLNLIEEGSQTEQMSLARFSHLQFLATQEERERIHDIISGLDIDSIQSMLKSCPQLFKDIDRLSLDAKTMTFDQFSEILAKKMALGFLTEGMIIPLPHIIDTKTGQASLESGYFEVRKVIKAKGLMAFALIPHHASSAVKPTILFRPTTQSLSHENAFETFSDDMCNNIGERSFNAAKKELFETLNNKEFLPQGERAHISGFSLGGAHAARTLAEWPDYFQKATFFNDPSTESMVALKFIRNLAHSSHSSTNPLEISIFHTDKDIVTHAGEMHVGYMSDASPFSVISKDKCKLKIQKILTVDSDNDTNHVFTPRIRDLASRTHRVVMQQKERHHCDVVLSDQRSLRRASRSSVSLSSLSGEDSPRVPRSPKLTAIEVLSPDYLNRQAVPEAARMNTYLRNQTALRTMIFGLCQIGSFFSWAASKIRNFGNYIVSILRDDSKIHYKEFLDSWFDILSVPPSFQPGYELNR